MRPHLHASLLLALLAGACGTETAPNDGGLDASGPADGGAADGGAVFDGGTHDADGPGDDGGAPPTGDIGTCDPTPGTCPVGSHQVDITTADELVDATRGDGAFASDPPSTCYRIAEGVYEHSANVLMWITRGGDPGAPRRFVGASRAGVVVHARATIEADHVVVENLTFDLTGYAHDGSFNTVTVGEASDVTLSHLDLTGDCATGLRGGHVEVDGGDGVVVECSTIERFGQCAGDGHLDHGVYLASGADITVRDNVIRDNSSRGIQLNTEGGDFGTLDGVTIERNRINGNGHRAYEDGIVINGTGTGTIRRVTIAHNLIYGNFYAGLRFVGAAQSEMVVRANTFYENGIGEAGGSPSEINLDDVGSGADTAVTRNLVVSSRPLIANCYDAAGRGFGLDDDLVGGSGGAGGDCVSGVVSATVTFDDAASGDFHTSTPEAAGYGAYAP
ncbi:MAG: right-handed parallel beta-helix repeat-containing protein [Myxococcales bacterium]|nr:right-handed parallel beta-helix repeat-containing protein [Myxococcales bacterium]